MAGGQAPEGQSAEQRGQEPEAAPPERDLEPNLRAGAEDEAETDVAEPVPGLAAVPKGGPREPGGVDETPTTHHAVGAARGAVGVRLAMG